MRLLIFLCLGALLASASAADDIDVVAKYDLEPALKDETKWKVVFDCFMERGPCGEIQDVKDAMVRLYTNKCEKCTPEQKETFDTIIKRVVDRYPKDSAEIINKYSPKPE